MTITKITVIGGGLMGSGIAQVSQVATIIEGLSPVPYRKRCRRVADTVPQLDCDMDGHKC